MSTTDNQVSTLPPRERGLSPFVEPDVAFGPFDYLPASPFQTIRRMQEEMERMWSQIALGPQFQFASSNPRVDISEEPAEWRMDIDLPGVNKKDISVDILDKVLVIKAEMKRDEAAEKLHFYRRERRYGFFERRFTLPEGSKVELISSEFKNGVLSVHIPKDERANLAGRHIPVK